MPGTVDGRDASFFIEKWYRHLIGQDDINPQGGIDIAVWLQKIWGYYTFGAARDLLYDGRSDEFWASMILATNPTLVPPLPAAPTIADQSLPSVADTESVGFDVGTPTFTGTGVTWSITAGNGAGKFSINASTGLIELAATLNFWNTPSYSLTVQVTNAGGSDSATVTIDVTNVYSDDVIQFLKMIETSGVAAADSSPFANAPGVYSGVTLNAAVNPGGVDGAPLGDGVNDRCAIHSANLNTRWNGQRFTVSLWFKAFDSNFWSAGGAKALLRIGVDASNFLLIYRSAVNQLTVNYTSGGVERERNIATSSLAWQQVAVTVDLSVGTGEMKTYFNAAQQGVTQVGLGTWAGSLDANACNLFMNTVASPLPANVYESYYRAFDEALPATEITKLNAEFTG